MLTSFEAFTAVMFQVEVLWVVTPYSAVVGYRRFGGPCCLHLHHSNRTLCGVTTKTSTWRSSLNFVL